MVAIWNATWPRYDCASPAVSQNGLARRAAVREAGKSIDVHRRSDTATIWQGHDWGHRRVRVILLIYKSMVYDVVVVAARPTIYRKSHENPLEINDCRDRVWRGRESNLHPCNPIWLTDKKIARSPSRNSPPFTLPTIHRLTRIQA